MNDTFTLPNGVSRPLAALTFDAALQRAFYGRLDVTPYLTRAQLQAVGGSAFDVERANRAASDQAREDNGLAPYADGKDFSWADVAKDTASGIGNDLATAAQSIRDFAGIGPENAGKRSPLFWTLLLAGLGFLAYQLGVFAWVRKKLSA